MKKVNEQRGAYRSVEDRHGRFVRLSDHGNGRRPSFSKGGQNEKTMRTSKGFYNVNGYSREESPDLNEVELELGSIESTIEINSISCIPKLILKKCRLVFYNDQEKQKMVALLNGGETNSLLRFKRFSVTIKRVTSSVAEDCVVVPVSIKFRDWSGASNFIKYGVIIDHVKDSIYLDVNITAVAYKNDFKIDQYPCISAFQLRIMCFLSLKDKELVFTPTTDVNGIYWSQCLCEQRMMLDEVLRYKILVFQRSTKDVGRTHIIKHSINNPGDVKQDRPETSKNAKIRKLSKSVDSNNNSITKDSSVATLDTLFNDPIIKVQEAPRKIIIRLYLSCLSGSEQWLKRPETKASTRTFNSPKQGIHADIEPGVKDRIGGTSGYGEGCIRCLMLLVGSFRIRSSLRAPIH
ncbi:hypothetical protein BpHYR1_052654 [Brachionus plicatilis]|uniref:Uncharacterized protein n=1 Tax=Brachionus plicatilis TaxID=10195 RepID=A0A3M7QFH9_BRAPC|nr:hypothetical protein BpHYR1_052654 [Brachionus plicatilis]